MQFSKKREENKTKKANAKVKRKKKHALTQNEDDYGNGDDYDGKQMAKSSLPQE